MSNTAANILVLSQVLLEGGRHNNLVQELEQLQRDFGLLGGDKPSFEYWKWVDGIKFIGTFPSRWDQDQDQQLESELEALRKACEDLKEGIVALKQLIEEMKADGKGG